MRADYHRLARAVRWPQLSPEQALLLWELVDHIASVIWDHYEQQIVERIATDNRDARPRNAPENELPF
jgi:hypothetical protein